MFPFTEGDYKVIRKETECQLIRQSLSQRCRMTPQLISSLGIQVGDLIRVTPKNNFNTYICVLWPLVIPGTLYAIEIDKSVTVNCSYNSASLQSMNSTSVISALKYICAKTATVLVTVTSMDSFLTWNKKKLELAHFVKIILQQFYVVKNCTLHCIEHPLAKLCGIYNIIIEQLDSNDATVITKNTVLSLKSLWTKDRFLQQKKKEIHIGGLKKELEKLKDIFLCPACNDGSCIQKNVLINGPAGVGKTILVKKAAYEANAHLVMLSAFDVQLDRCNSESILRSIWKRAKLLSKEGPCVFLLSEIETICPRREPDSVHSKNGMIALFSLLMDDSIGNLIVVGETTKPDNIEPSVRRRFEHEILIGVPNCSQREEILTSIAHAYSICMDSNINFKSLAKRTPGYVGADLAMLYREAALNSFRTNSTLVLESVSLEDLEAAFRIVKSSTQKDCIWHMNVKPVLWDEIGGMDNIKQTMKQHIEWPILYSKQFRKMGLPHPKGVLLYGPPGCCKTTLVQAAATSCNATFFSVSSAQIFSPYVGDSEKAIAELFHKARLGAPSIIFFDEIDALVGKRGFKGHGGVHEKVLSALLNEMDGIGFRQYYSKEENGEKERPNVVIVAATNRLDLIDEAILRPGRFSIIVDVPLPDETLRESILRALANKMPLSVDFRELASKTNGFSGADLKSLCHEAALNALSANNFDACRVTMDNFIAVMHKIKPSIDSKQLELYKVASNRQNI